jgi:hypothetical protein
MRGYKQTAFSLALGVILALSPAFVYAQSSSSNNYRVDQTLFGTGGELDAQSDSYRARQTVGELGVGQTDSANYRAFAGFNTTDEPFIEFVVTSANIDLGYLSPNSASTATGTFYVRAWQAGGYVVRSESDPPTNTAGSGSQIAPLTTPTGSSPGTEQFGINLVDNSGPNIGANPQQVPDNTFSFGVAEPDYDTPNLFKHVKGDIVARSLTSTSVTIYTVSYLFNINETTPAGQYTFRHNLVATATY